MRKGFDSLSGIVASHMQLNALDGSVFIFINKKRDQIKLLLWEGDGFALYHKRLEKGTYELPHPCLTASCRQETNDSSSINISAQQLQFILQGVSLEKVHFRVRYKKTA